MSTEDDIRAAMGYLDWLTYTLAGLGAAVYIVGGLMYDLTGDAVVIGLLMGICASLIRLRATVRARK